MKVEKVLPPRRFEVGANKKITISDCARIHLDSDEQVTFMTEAGAEYDVTRKAWGFYATPSTNSRLKRFNLRAVLIKNRAEQLFVLLVESDKKELFDEYVRSEELEILLWLDDQDALVQLSRLHTRAS